MTQNSPVEDVQVYLEPERLAQPERLILEATAYTINDPGMDGKGITATGTKARPWFTVATDPQVVPMGSALYVPILKDTSSRGFVTAEDRGGDIKGHALDICFPTRKEAMQFGRHHIEVFVLPPDTEITEGE